jgi:DNA repair protein RadD
MILRPYQAEAHAAVMAWVRRSVDPCLIEAPTGAGKSLIIAALARDLHAISGCKHILCIAPSAELVQQNHEKYLATGNPASMFSASAGEVSLRHPVVFGTPQTIKNKLRRFGSQFCAVIVDECHRITPTVKFIIEQMREANQNLRVIGLSATPYRLGSGYIYQIGPDGMPAPDWQCRDPYFMACVYQISAHSLIDQGYLSRPLIGTIAADHYDTSKLQLNRRGQFDAADIDRAFHGHGRKTSAIIGDIVEQSKGRKGVMIFAATVQHAEECLASLPPKLSALVTGKTGQAERAEILKRFKAREIKYLVNVAVLTTGFDASHVDLVALLRATESVSLLQQIIGRGLRIDPGKADCLILDYAENLDRHCPDGDIFTPNVIAAGQSSGSESIEVICPKCSTPQMFSKRPNPNHYEISDSGYFLEADGLPVVTEFEPVQPVPAHFGRRCRGLDIKAGRPVECDYRWSLKVCRACGEENDIAARYCTGCKGELIDPNEKLKISFKAKKRDPSLPQCDEVLEWQTSRTVSQRGNECEMVKVKTPYRSFTVWLQINGKSEKAGKDWNWYCKATENGTKAPRTIAYIKEPSGFYRLIGYNLQPDVSPEDQKKREQGLTADLLQSNV